MKKFYSVFVVLGIVLVTFMLFKYCIIDYTDRKEGVNLIAALNDSLQVVKKSNDEKSYLIQTLQLENSDNFIKIKTANEEIKELQELVSKNKKAKTATIVKTITKVDTVFAIRDLNSNYWEKDLRGYGKWVTGKITLLKKDTLNKAFDLGVNLKIFDELNIIHKKDKDGKMFVEVTNSNPFSEVKSLRSYYQIENYRKKRFSIGPNLSYGFNSDGKSSIFLGLGVQYGLINF